MAENYQKKELIALMNQGANKLCVDCNAPSPQWASVSFGTFICLECSGVHRGFGVHISFVRSITMDKWSEEQFKKMKLGGNEAFKSFMSSYGPEGGYTPNMGMVEKYNSWAATQYREKLAADCAEPPQAWSKSAPPPPSAEPAQPPSAQATRKSRSSGANARSASPFSQGQDGLAQQGSANEAFFSSLGERNASRPDHLPPSQGGKYGGFGSAPEPDAYSSHPSHALSSHAVPTFDDLQRDPAKALSRGWGLLASAIGAASSTINDTVVKPGVSRAQEVANGSDDWRKVIDGARGATGWLSQRAGEGWEGVNDLAKQRGGVDLNEQLGKLGISGTSNGGRGAGYGQLDRAEGGDLPAHGGKKDDDDFFEAWDTPEPSTKSRVGAVAKPAPERDDWAKEQWKDF